MVTSKNNNSYSAAATAAMGALGGPEVAGAMAAAKYLYGAYQRAPQRRRAGGGNGGTRRRQPTGRPARNGGRRRRALQMPENVLYQERRGRTDFSATSTKDLQRQAWKFHPATSNLMAPRGLGYYDAFCMSCSSAVTSMTIGPTTPITGITIVPRIATDYNAMAFAGHSPPLSTALGEEDAQLLVIGPARGKVQARIWKARGHNKNSAAAYTDHICPQLDNDQPVDGLPARCSVQIKNFTNGFARGGRVRVLRATTGRTMIPELTTNEDLWELMSGIRSHWRCATYDGEDFAGKGTAVMQKNAIVLDQTRTLTFSPFDYEKPLADSDLWWEKNSLGNHSDIVFKDPDDRHDILFTLLHDKGECFKGAGTEEGPLDKDGNLDPQENNPPETVREAAEAAYKAGYKYFAFRDRFDPEASLTIASGSTNPQTYGVAPALSTQSTVIGDNPDCDCPAGYDGDGFDYYKIHDVPLVDAFTEYMANPTFTPIFVLFEPCVTTVAGGSLGNEYEVKICSQFHCHFKQGSTLANMAKEPKTNLGVVNRATHQEEGLGSYMMRTVKNELAHQMHSYFS